MIKVNESSRRARCLSCGQEHDIVNVSIGRNEQSLSGLDICNNCLLELVLKTDLYKHELEVKHRREMNDFIATFNLKKKKED